jgi:hypothetical protein
VSGKVTTEDYGGLPPVLNQTIVAHGRIHLLVVIGDMEGWGSLDAAKTDFHLGTQQYCQVEKAAFVGDKKWQEWAIKIMDPQARRTTERFFDSARLEEAWQWAKGG